jgi:hypothetical protein
MQRPDQISSVQTRTVQSSDQDSVMVRPGQWKQTRAVQISDQDRAVLRTGQDRVSYQDSVVFRIRQGAFIQKTV